MKTWIWYALGAAVLGYFIGRRRDNSLYVSRGGTANYATDDFKRDFEVSATVTDTAPEVETIVSELDQWTL